MPREMRPEEELARAIAYNNPVKFFLMGVLCGAVIGGVLGVLYAPMKGSETRQLIRDKAEDAVRMAQNKAADIMEGASEVAEDVREKAAETRKRGEEMLKAVREGGS